MKHRTFTLLGSASLFAIAATAVPQAAFAQGASATGFELEEIVVTARRKDESLQDVPTTINAVTGEDLQKLNIKTFADVASVVPGLTLATGANGISTTASVRGVNFDVNASGNNPTVEFYLNDAPISAANLFQTAYDIQQIEVLRGPQGTLRGRASPSGSITVTTHRPDLQEMGGYVSGSGNNIGGYNGQGAFNFPLISNVLAIRVAGAYDRNEGDRVISLNSAEDPYSKTKSGRATIRFEPTDTLSFMLTAQTTRQDAVSFDAVESQQFVDPNAAVNPGAPGGGSTLPVIAPSDRLSVEDGPRRLQENFNNYNFQAQWAFLGQKLNYVGARNEQHYQPVGDQNDMGDYFPTNYPAFTKGYAQSTDTHAYTTAHELRISNEERVFGMFDYIVGGFQQQGNFPTDLLRPTVVLFGAPSPTVGGLVVQTPIIRRGGSLEDSVFANLTAHVGDSLEVSGGARHIDYNSHGTLVANGTQLPTAEDNGKSFHSWVYTAAVKYNFTEDLMAYGTFGTSWRPGLFVVGDFNATPTALEKSFLNLPPEKSKSFEIGLKSTAMDKRLRTNVSVYHQKFDNYPYRSTSGVYYANQAATQQVALFNFVAPVPVEVNGVEASVDFAPIASWDMGAQFSVSKGEIKDGVVPCNDYAPTDGVPDNGVPASFAAIQAATGDNLATCKVSQRSANSPQWNSVLQSEYRVPVTSELNGFVRGLVSIYGNSKNDPVNTVDDNSAYALLNLFTGIRSANGVWEVSLYGKNVTNTFRVTSTSSSAQTTAYNIGATAQSGATNYYGGSNTSGLTYTPPREFGLSRRYAFGSK